MTSNRKLLFTLLCWAFGFIGGYVYGKIAKHQRRKKQRERFIRKNYCSIKSYNDALNDIAKFYRKREFEDFQLLMTSVQNIHQRIAGIGMPRNDEISGYWGINVVDRDYCVCRNMACYLADLLNKINPKYKAEMLCVKMKDTSNEMAFAVRNAKCIGDDKIPETKNKNKFAKFFEMISSESNHAIVRVKIDNDYIYVDPLNCGIIGAYRKGKIRFFNSGESDTSYCVISRNTTEEFRKNSITHYSWREWTKISIEKYSSLLSDKNWKRLYDKYNVEEQRKANMAI